MKTVFTNSMCTHVWAQQKQPRGRGPSMHFDDSVFYSYETPIARLVRGACLLTSERYSVTTAKHMSHARRAVRGNCPVFTVPDLFPDGTDTAGWYGRGRSSFPSHATPDHSGNVAHYLGEYEKARAELMRVPGESYRVRNAKDAPEDDGTMWTHAHITLREIADKFAEYSRHFGLGFAAPDWKTHAAEVIARRDRLLNDPKAMAKRAARAAIRAAAEERARKLKAAAEAIERERSAEAIKRWRAGDDVWLSYGAQRDEHGGAMLRIKGDNVQTSLGAEAPLSHVRRVLAFVESISAACLPWKRNAEFIGRDLYTLGHFALDSVDADRNVRAGCHFITAAEVSALREALRDKFAAEQQQPRGLGSSLV